MKKQQVIKKNKVGNKKELPRIYRIITALRPSTSLKADAQGSERQADSIFWVSVVSVVLLVLVSYIAFNTYVKLNELRKLTEEREKIVFEISHWEKIATNYKDYRDAYFKLAILEYQLGESEKSKNYLKKALELDPNFENGRELEKIL